MRPVVANTARGHRGFLVAVYGTLRVGGRLHHHLGPDLDRWAFVARAKIAGAMYEVADDSRDVRVGVTYPCFVANDLGLVVVDVVRILDESLLAELDELEGFDPTGTTVNEYTRRTIALHDVRMPGDPPPATSEKPSRRNDAPGQPPAAGLREAWIYEYVRHPVDPQRLVRGGDWIAYVEERDAGQPGSSYL